ncbi:unnamed protein product [Hymenolepis diminuta]|uniref:Uncharacterized protein n=1 Tax=Hymenolepis diminuta TaxID=6216 RepID=A0A0R3SP22_HYMDI|nr:unnamed protein product [Hymenolepis diminuta]
MKQLGRRRKHHNGLERNCHLKMIETIDEKKEEVKENEDEDEEEKKKGENEKTLWWEEELFVLVWMSVRVEGDVESSERMSC